jgi:23S rRNA pseudouridine2457 synthase
MTTILLNKPMNVLSHFTSEGGHKSLRDFVPVKDVYAAGRLDRDSEGLLVLTDDGALQNRIASPKFKSPKSYWVLVERLPDAGAMEALRGGVELKDGRTKPAEVEYMDTPKGLWERDPPVRSRKTVDDYWLKITIREGRNRQVRRMVAVVGHPCLRLIRYSVGDWTLEGLDPGEWIEV